VIKIITYKPAYEVYTFLVNAGGAISTSALKELYNEDILEKAYKHLYINKYAKRYRKNNEEFLILYDNENFDPDWAKIVGTLAVKMHLKGGKLEKNKLFFPSGSEFEFSLDKNKREIRFGCYKIQVSKLLKSGIDIADIIEEI